MTSGALVAAGLAVGCVGTGVSGTLAASGLAAVCVGAGVSVAVGARGATVPAAGRDGIAVSAGCRVDSGVAVSAGSPPRQPAAATITAVVTASVSNVSFDLVDDMRLVPDDVCGREGVEVLVEGALEADEPGLDEPPDGVDFSDWDDGGSVEIL